MSIGQLEDQNDANFLKRVEDLDSQRQHSKNSKVPPRIKGKPYRLNVGNTEDSLATARGIINGSYKESDHYRAVIDGTADTVLFPSISISNSPKKEVDSENIKKHPHISKEFVVSEEDYILLQKLKASTEFQDDDTFKLKHPARGKPRNRGHKENPYEEKSPSLPTRKYRSIEPSNRDEEEEHPPALPRKTGNFIRNTGDINEGVGNELSNSNTESSNYSNGIGEVSNRVQNNCSRDLKPKLEENTTLNMNLKTFLKLNRNTKPSFSQEDTPFSCKERIPERTYQEKLIRHNNIKPEPPVSRIAVKPKSFINSLEENTITNSRSRAELPLTKIKMASNIDYFDSVQKRPTSTAHLDGPLNKIPVKSSKITISDKEGFIGSALKSNIQHSLEKKKPIPLLPRKPQALKSKAEINEKDKAEYNLVEERPFRESLKKVEYIKPKVPEKKPDILIPKLRSVGKVKPMVPRKKSTINVHELKPVKPSQKAEVIEIELNSVVLKKRSGTDLNRRKPSIPEALQKQKTLNKAKTAPAIPQRKISMPDALAKAQSLREEKFKAHTDKVEKNTEATSREQPGMILSVNLSKFGSLKLPFSPGYENSMEFNYGLTRASTDVSISSVTSGYNTDSSSRSLNHPNKSRAKGPKRKLPSKLS